MWKSMCITIENLLLNLFFLTIENRIVMETESALGGEGCNG